MKTLDAKYVKGRIVAAAVLVGAVLSIITYLFLSTVREQLWQQSIHTILESTHQGCNTLRVQLEEEYRALENAAAYLAQTGQTDDETDSILKGYTQIDEGVSLYTADGTCFPFGMQADDAVVQALALDKNDKAYGILDPHISSVTGVNVFDLFVRLTMADGTAGYLVKEYEVASIVDSFSLSFYQDAGFSYVVDADGNVLIRPPHPGSNKTVQNLFDILRESSNDTDSLQQFIQSLASEKSGWATFSYQEEQTVFCYLPIKMGSDWYLISIIPQAVVSAQTNQIFQRTFVLIASIIAGIALLVILYIAHTNHAAKKLRSQADYIGHLYNAIPEGIALLTAEPPYCFLQLNQEGLRLLAYPQDAGNDAPKGRSLQEALFPENYEQITGIFQKTVRSGQKNLIENRMLRLDGSSFWASGIVEKILDKDGKDILVVTFHDITARKLAEEAAEREKLQERSILVGAISNIYPIIISLNLSKDTLKFIYLRQGLMIDLENAGSYSQLYEKNAALIHPDDQNEFQCRFAPQALCRTLGKDRREVFLEAKHLLTDGQYHWTSTQIIYVDNPYSNDQLAVLLSRRIDEQRYEEEQRRQALQSALAAAKAASVSKSQFLSNMSHDIRTPMNAIIGMTAIASSHLDDRARVMECLKKIGLSGQHLLSLINDILDMSKIESGKLSLRKEAFNFAKLVSDAAELLRPQALASRIEMTIELSALKQETVIGDALRVRQVYLNIISNAVKYTLAGGSVHIEAWEEGEERKNYFFRCADTGVGMDQDFLGRLFQPFERMQNSTTSKITGTGLGMAITKNLVDLMGGDIHVESAPGKGAVFTVTLPLQRQDAQQAKISSAWLGVRSLVVDDDLQTCKNAAGLLNNMGLRAEFVTEGKAAIDRVIQEKNTKDPFALVVIDWKMPQMDGVEVTRYIRHEVGPHVPIIILTAYDWSEIENEARAAGATSFLTKPFYRSKFCYLLNELNGLDDAEEELLPSARNYAGYRILLAEDNDINREIARTLIEELGAAVEEAFDGAQAVQKISQSQAGYYDLVFMDIQMPYMDGYQAAQAIRALDRTDVKSLPIIAMTANAFEEDVRAALRAGMNAHFAKPIEVKKLEQFLNQYLPEK